MIAVTHVPSPRMGAGLRTFVERTPIDADLAMRQHVELRRMLGRCGALVRTIDGNRDLPDGAFIEDAAVVLDEVAVLTSMGAATRRLELPVVAKELAKYRTLERIEPPAALEGGDVLVVGRKLLVGLSSRTDAAGVKALDSIVRRHGYSVVPVSVGQSLHLKTACTALDDATLLLNPSWLDAGPLARFELIPVPEEEPWAANVLRIGDRICMAAGHSRTTELIRKRGLPVETIDLSEFAKAEAGITCLSILFSDTGDGTNVDEASCRVSTRKATTFWRTGVNCLTCPPKMRWAWHPSPGACIQCWCHAHGFAWACEARHFPDKIVYPKG